MFSELHDVLPTTYSYWGYLRPSCEPMINTRERRYIKILLKQNKIKTKTLMYTHVSSKLIFLSDLWFFLGGGQYNLNSWKQWDATDDTL